MNRIPFERVTPESVGISSETILRFLDALEGPHTQMHGLMIMRHGKVCTEGWWQPYAPGKRHTCHSLTKTYMGTAVGIAIREGLLSLDDKLVDIFPEYKDISTISNVTVRHILCMGAGVTSMPSPSEEWVRDFFLQPQVHEPGTAFFYNSAGSTLLAYVIERVSGTPVYDYLKPRLFDKIGIDSRVSFPNEVAPENDMWGHRMQSTTEDNLRLMKLYLDGGVVNGERILDEDYVAMATSLQNESATESINNPVATDNFVGYGFQMWMCTRKGAYRADGSGGQFSVVVPDLDLIVSITESAAGAYGAQHTLDCIWDVLLPGVTAEPLPENAQQQAYLANRLSRLAIPAPKYQPYSSLSEEINGKTYSITEGVFELFYAETLSRLPSGDPEGTLTFNFNMQEGTLLWKGLREPVSLVFGLDGAWRRDIIQGPHCNATECYAAAYWADDHTLDMTIFWTEGVTEKHLVFQFEGEKLTITGKADYLPLAMEMGKPVDAVAVVAAD